MVFLPTSNHTQVSGLELRSAVSQSCTLHHLHSPQPPPCDLFSVNKCENTLNELQNSLWEFVIFRMINTTHAVNAWPLQYLFCPPLSTHLIYYHYVQHFSCICCLVRPVLPGYVTDLSLITLLGWWSSGFILKDISQSFSLPVTQFFRYLQVITCNTDIIYVAGSKPHQHILALSQPWNVLERSIPNTIPESRMYYRALLTNSTIWCDGRGRFA